MARTAGGFPPQSRVNARPPSESGDAPRSIMRLRFCAALLALPMAQAVESQVLPVPADRLTYADLADLALAPLVAVHLRIRDADALGAREAPNVPAGRRRFLVEADVVALIRGADGLPARVSYLVDVANDSRGRPARLRRRDEVLVLASRVANRPAELRLVAPDAQLPYAAETAARPRAVPRDSTAGGGA